MAYMPRKGCWGKNFILVLNVSVIRANTRRRIDILIVCYEELCALISRVFHDETFNLIEALAERIANTTLSRFQQVEIVRVQVRKPSAPIPDQVDYVGVEVTRRRDR